MKDVIADNPPLGAAGRVRSAPVAVRFTWQLALFLLLNLVVINGLLAWLSPGGVQDTVLQHMWDVLNARGGDDSWGPMAAALEYLRGDATKPLYQAIFFEQGIKFQYPPSALFALEGMNLFGEDRVRTYDEMVFAGAPAINDILGWAFLALTAMAAAGLVEAGLGYAGIAPGSPLLRGVRIGIVCVLAFSFYPVVKAFTLGQIQLWINALFALALLLWVLRRPVASGALMGLICLMKPHYGLFLLWGLLNRQWRFALACGVVGATGLFFSLMAYGWSNHMDYLSVLSFMSERGESYYANQSVNGLLNRIASLSASAPQDNASFNAFQFPPYNPWVYWGTLISSAVILLAGLLRKPAVQVPGLAFAILGVSLTIASPIAWEHHYGVMLPAFALLAAINAGRPQRLALVALAFIFVSNFIVVLNLSAATPYNFVQSYMLAGGLFFLLLMHRQLSEVQSTKS